MVGKAGEVYGRDVCMGRKHIRKPLVQITDPNGKILAQGKFSVG